MVRQSAFSFVLACALLMPSHANADTSPPIPAETDIPIALLVDISSGQVLFSRNAHRRFVPASITKVMTLYHAFELIKDGKIAPRQSLVMSDEAWEQWHGEGSTMWINAGDRVSVSDLLTGIANVSANDASIMLAEGQAGSVAAWLDAMNAQARTLDMANSRFGTPNGWPDEGATFTTANDLVKLAKAIVTRHPDLVARYMGKPGFRYNGIEQRNRDPMIGRVEGADGLKTGYTNESGFGYLGTARRGDQRLVLVIAGTRRGSVRDNSARALMEWGFDEFVRESLFSEGTIVGQARVQGGSARSVDLVTERDVFVNVPRGRTNEMSMRIEYNGPLRAPLNAGDSVATLVVEVPGMEPARLPLIVSRNVPKAGFFARLINGIAGWFS